ncbi:MAG: hypothetical protein GXO09_03325 [Crenarchaeota archaeon]|nr:hypothetical protein [Thermoproteota archaeon]
MNSGRKLVIIYPGGVRVIDNASRLVEEIRDVARRIGRGRIIVAELGRVLLEADASVLSELMGYGAERRPEEAPVTRSGRVCAVFDQMYKGFADIIARELRDDRLVLHEIVGRGLEKPVKASERVFRQPARDDYDILRLLRRLARECRVVFFTGDKKLANQAALIENVEVEYMPPGEFTGKEAAIDAMIAVLRKAMNIGGAE